MDKFSIFINGKEFKFEKFSNKYYEITPFDEKLAYEDLSNALIKQKKYYIASIGKYNPIQIKEPNEYGEVIKPFKLINNCFIALIEPSKNKNFKE